MPDPQGLDHRTCGILRRAVRTSNLLVREQLLTRAGEAAVRNWVIARRAASSCAGRCLHSCHSICTGLFVCLCVCVAPSSFFLFCYKFIVISLLSRPSGCASNAKGPELSLATYACSHYMSFSYNKKLSKVKQMFLGEPLRAAAANRRWRSRVTWLRPPPLTTRTTTTQCRTR